MALEREIKLQFATAAEARAAVLKGGARPLAPRRLQQDQLLDTDGGLLVGRGCALRVRTESGGARLTFKGPVEPSSHKLRDELETRVADAEVLLQVLAALGFSVRFRYEKYREEFAGQDVIIAVDETPVGTFVEIEGSEDGIRSTAAALGRGEADYVLHSYRRLYLDDCVRRGRPAADMLFNDA